MSPGPSLHPGQRAPNTRLRDQIAVEIERLILDGRWQPGEYLPHERALTDQYQVSRTVVRDAIALLAERGLVEIRPGRGTVVAAAHPNPVLETLRLLLRRNGISVGELVEARFFLEERTANLAAQRATAEDIAALERTLAAMEAAQGRPLPFVQADIAFHEALADAAKNRVLSSYLTCARELLLDGMLAGCAAPGAMEHAVAAHAAILRSVQRRDPAAGQRQMRAHLRQSRAELVAVGYVGIAGPALPPELVLDSEPAASSLTGGSPGDGAP